MSLEWTRPDQWHLKSDCGRYYISKGLVMGTPWYLVHRGRKSIGERHATVESAMEAAEADAALNELHPR